MTSYAAAASRPARLSTSPIAQANEGGTTMSPAARATTPNQMRIRQLMDPPPSSFTLRSALALLQPETPGSVYLMDVAYLQNWFVWALHQQTGPAEKSRNMEAIRLSALTLGLVPLPAEDMPFKDPGPIDSSVLSVEGHPLILSPLAQVLTRQNVTAAKPLQERVRSFTNLEDLDQKPAAVEKKLACVAVPEDFYEMLRSVHGVLCDDAFSVSFQKMETERLLLLHNVHAVHPLNNDTVEPSPIEFRRKIIQRPAYSDGRDQAPKSLMDKLLLEEKALNTQLEPTVETHPMKVHYKYEGDGQMAGGTDKPSAGFGLVSRDTLAVDAIAALQRAALPSTSIECTRVWSRPGYGDSRPTREGDGWEIVNLDLLNSTKHRWNVQEWVQQHAPSSDTLDVHIWFETRLTKTSPWPRESATLGSRLQVGDFVDAQDVAGKWFEAVVFEVDDFAVKVHYTGWSSKWDTTIRRYGRDTDVEGVMHPKLSPPVPLWSQTKRWRDRICVGDIVEIRDSSSIVERPKWYRGVVKKVGGAKDPVQKTEGGATLEVYPVPGHTEKHQPLLLLARTQQVLVEVPQERNEHTVDSPGEGDLAAGMLQPDPPFLRWVNLFGEEICQLGTHLKDELDNHAPALVTYDFESHRKPVEVLKSHHPSLGAGFMRESLRGVPPAPGSVGLHNLGNSCFLNSTIQCLNHIEPLSQFFLQEKYRGDLNRKNPLGSGGNVAMAYGDVLKRMWGGEYSTLAPRMLKQTVAAFAPQFDNCYQHDSQEFCQFLMDGLHEDLNRVQSKPYVEELEGFGMEDSKAAIESWRKHLLRHDSIIVDHCQGMHRSHLTCPRCGRESIKFDVYSSLSVPVVSNKKRTVVTLYDCLDQFMEGEQLDERNAWYCPKCRQHVCALKMISLWTVPDVLIVHLKRFTFDTCMTSGNMLRAKVDDKVEFPIENLDLSKYVLGPIDPEAGAAYKLIGVSEHMGPTANSGHYTATIRNSVDGQWYRCNDSHVGRTSGEASITGGAYVLFYQRTKRSSQWGGMHKVMSEKGIDPYGGLNKDQDGFATVKSKKKRK